MPVKKRLDSPFWMIEFKYKGHRYRQSVRARLRNLVRLTLKKYKYPPNHQMEAIDLVLKQAEVLSDQFSQ